MRLTEVILCLVGLSRVESMDLTNQRFRGAQFSKIWSLSTAYRENDVLYKKFMWRRLLEHEVYADSGNIRPTAFPHLCAGNDKSRDASFSKWRLITLEDIEGLAFQQLLLDNSDFGSYRMDDRIPMRHVLAMKSMRMPQLSEMVVVLTVGDDRLSFQVEIFPLNEQAGKNTPTDVLCVTWASTLTSTLLPPTTTSQSKILTEKSTETQVGLFDCATNTMAAVVKGEPPLLDTFLIHHRAILFVLSLCCPALIILFATLLVLLIKRYRALNRSRQRQLEYVREKAVVRKHSIHSPQLPHEENLSCDLKEPLWPKHSSPMLAVQMLEDINDIDEYVLCDRLGDKSANTLPLKKPSVGRGILKRTQTISSSSSYHTDRAAGHVCNQFANIDADLGAIAAKRFRDILRRKTVDQHEFMTSSHAKGTLYSLLRQREMDRSEDCETENAYS